MNNDILNTLAAWAGVVLALVSLGWNIYNTRQMNKKAGVNLELNPVSTEIPEKRGMFPAWFIINDSGVTVFIKEIGFSSARRELPFFRKRKGLETVPVLSPILTDCPERYLPQQWQTAPFPLRLDAWESVTLAAPDLSELETAKHGNYHYIYVTTSNERSFIADMGDLKRLRSN